MTLCTPMPLIIVCVCVCVCVRERERERVGDPSQYHPLLLAGYHTQTHSIEENLQ